MDESAAECVRRWRFKPSEKDGSPVAVLAQTEVVFNAMRDARMWGAGPLVFAADPGVAAPVLKSGALPGGQHETGDEAVLLEFTINAMGEVGEIHALAGQESKSLSALNKSLAGWKFTPATGVAGPVQTKGKALFLKGEDYFRFQVSKAFRESGSVHLPETKPIDGAAPKSVTTFKVMRRIDLSPQEAVKQLVRQVPPEYPDEAKKAHVSGIVSLVVVIGTDGLVANVKPISGPPALVPYAIAAVKQWQFRPVISHGEPVEAQSVIDVVFNLGGR
jgi:TonB family protein